MKDPLKDMIQDVDKQRTSMMMELERTQVQNRQLLHQSMQQLGQNNL